MKISKLFLTLGLLTATAHLILAAPASAGPNSPTDDFTIRVNSTADEVDVNLQDGKCKSASGKCTLRAAIQTANANSSFNEIRLKAGDYRLGIPGQDDEAAKGDLDILSSLIIYGAGASGTVIDGNGLDRVFHLPNEQVIVTLAFLTVRNGKANNQNGGGIFNNSNLTLDHVLIEGNSATQGGGIYNTSGVRMAFGVLRANQAAIGGGAANGGSQVTMHLEKSTVSHNFATNNGGGIATQGGPAWLTTSTLALNRANNHGGGVYNTQDGSVHFSHVTATQNNADDDNKNGGDGGGIFTEADGGAWLENSILAQNLDKSGAASNSKPHDCSGVLNDAGDGHNLLGNSFGCSGLVNASNGNQVGTPAAPLSAKLGPLAPNGGATATALPMSDSPVRNAGTPGDCLDEKGSETDQRGYVRVVGGRCDIGAVEIAAACAKPAKPILVTPYEDQLVTKSKVKFQWLPSDCADTYRLLLRQDDANGPKVFKKQNMTGTSVKTTPLAPGHFYWVFLKACNPAGCTKHVGGFTTK